MDKSKKVVLVIVEGESDKVALYPSLKKISQQYHIHFEVVACDITSDAKLKKPLKGTVGDIIRQHSELHRFNKNDFLLVAQLTDTDGAFVDEEYVRIDSTVNDILYALDGIYVPNEAKMTAINLRNTRKANNLRLLSTTSKIAGIRFQIFFFSANLDHCLHECANLANSEKINKATMFQQKHASCDAFINFFTDLDLILSNEYTESWNQIQIGQKSLSRYSNFNLFLDQLIP